MSTDYSSEPKSAVLGIVKPFLALVTGIACAVNAYGQTLIPGLSAGGGMRPLQADLAVLELRQPRRDLQCDVTAPKPELGFDFMFHTGYEVRVPIRELAGIGNELTVVFRVVPEDRHDDPSYMVQKVPVPALEAHSRGEGKFDGIFTLGEGKYHVDWLMRDQRERTCSMSWDLETRLNSKDSQLRQWIPSDLVQLRTPLFAAEPPVIRAPENGTPRFSIIVNFDPSDPSAALIDEPGLYGLLAILRRMGRDPRIELHSIIICSFETQKVVYRQGNEGRGIDLPALGEALQLVKLGTVDAKRLASTNGPGQFAADLIRQQLKEDNSDALVVLGSKGGPETGVSRQALESFDKLGKPAFYLSYVTGQQGRPSRDLISSIMKHLRGFEYRIDRPKDFFNAWSDVVARIVRTMQAPQSSIAAAPATQ
jgi:hypothetical protein